MQGWIKLPREITKEGLWDNGESHCCKCAFIDLMLLASHRRREIVFDNQPIQLEEGEIISSQRGLGERWGWSHSKVNRYLKALQAVGLVQYQANSKMTRIRLCKWKSYQIGQVPQRTAVRTADEPQTKNRRKTDEKQTRTYNNDKNVYKEKNDKKKEPDFHNLEFIKAKKPENELTPEERIIFSECQALYQQMFKTVFDYNKLATLVYGSAEDTEEYGFGDWQTLRKALGYLSNQRLTYKVLHPHYYLWGKSRDRDFVEKMKKMAEETSSYPSFSLP
ncbi:MAG: hypothetical protein A2Z27_05775 [candidate division Zixibacteria bacterium RBG_16_50_21]|nr:MAG: hypothetical protein A2Z27_05775 [candidate division Zixibacteria bacterium RBG_16_50_21]